MRFQYQMMFLSCLAHTVTQWVSLVKLELLTLQKHRFQPWLLSASWFSIFSFLCNVLWIMVFPFVSDLLVIVLCVL